METQYIQQIETLRSQGKTYTEIAKILGITRFKLYYHINPKYREQCKQQQVKHRNSVHPYKTKLVSFTIRSSKSSPAKNLQSHSNYRKLYRKVWRFNMKENHFTVEDVIKKFGEHPRCYLTNEPIDIYQTNTYHFDHIIPTSKGGPNTIDNLGICTAQANKMKCDMTPEQLLNMCRLILENNGFKVNK